MSNENLRRADRVQDDEYYTMYSTISNTIPKFRDQFKDKVVYCNCDDPTSSAFWRYFHLNFEEFGLKKLISTHYDKTDPTYKMEYEGGDDNDIEAGVKTPLEGNGDFRNKECLELLDEADIVASNPPFSLFSEYITTLVEHNKRFIIIGNMNAVTYKEVFPMIRNNEIWIGANEKGGSRKGNSLCFEVPEWYEGRTINVDGIQMAQVSAWWFTNMDFKKRHDKYTFWKAFDSVEFPKYANYEVVECGDSHEFPDGYDGVVGVPISFLNGFYNPDQFEIIGMAEDNGKGYSGEAAMWDGTNPHCVVNGKNKFKRIFVRRRQESA